MGYSSGRSDLKLKKRTGMLENSTGSCRFDPVKKEGFSYAQKLCFWDKRLNTWVFNTQNFSVTSSGHWSTLMSHLKWTKNTVSISAPTFNNCNNDVRKLEKIESFCEKAEKVLSKKQKKEASDFQVLEKERIRAKSKLKRIESILCGKIETSPQNYFKHIKNNIDQNYLMFRAIAFFHSNCPDSLLLYAIDNEKDFVKSCLESSTVNERFVNRVKSLKNKSAILSLVEEGIE
jgi:hypothetical protein